MRSIVSVTVLALLLSIGELAAQTTFDLSGQVRGQDGQPKPMVHVYFDGPQAQFVITGADGRFTVPGFHPGQYSVRVQRGHNAQTLLRDIRTGQHLDLTVGW